MLIPRAFATLSRANRMVAVEQCFRSCYLISFRNLYDITSRVSDATNQAGGNERGRPVDEGAPVKHCSEGALATERSAQPAYRVDRSGAFKLSAVVTMICRRVVISFHRLARTGIPAPPTPKVASDTA